VAALLAGGEESGALDSILSRLEDDAGGASTAET